MGESKDRMWMDGGMLSVESVEVLNNDDNGAK